MALEAIEKAQVAHPRPDPRHRLEHCTMIEDRHLERMVRLGAVALPFASYVWQHGEKLRKFYGRRADRMFAHASFLKAGVKTAASSDHPAGLHPPLLGIQSMVTRRTADGKVIGPAEKIDLVEAVRLYTTHAAYASREERFKGCLAPGRAADFVILDRDPWDVPPEEIGAIEVDRTVAGGRTTHRRPVM
jgi:predicted amidohydrolase YtcJ